MISGCSLNHGLEKVRAQKCGMSVRGGCAWFVTLFDRTPGCHWGSENFDPIWYLQLGDSPRGFSIWADCFCALYHAVADLGDACCKFGSQVDSVLLGCVIGW